MPKTAVMKWDEELAKQAELASKMESSTATGQFIGTKGGQLTFNDAPVPNNEMAVVILDAILENVYYEGAFDPDTPQGPLCFAFGRDDKEMKPHQDVVTAKNQQCGASGLCAGCDKNEFGTADVGKGKACRNTRRLALIPAGTFDRDGRFKAFTDEEHFKSASIAFMKLPVTSVKGYAAFVKQLAGALKRPPHAVFTKIKLVPDPKNQFKAVCEPLEHVPNDLMGTIMQRHKEAQSVIDFPYTPFEADETKPVKKGKRKPDARKY